MTNVEMIYGGLTYTIVRRRLDDVQAEIDRIVMSGIPGWIPAYDGHGSRTPTHLMISAGVPIALAEIPTESDGEAG